MIQAEHIKFDYIRRDEEQNVVAIENAINDVSFTVKKGEFVAVLGHNGSGKSTLAKHLNALLVPEEGTLYVDEIDKIKKQLEESTALPIDEVAKKCEPKQLNSRALDIAEAIKQLNSKQ